MSDRIPMEEMRELLRRLRRFLRTDKPRTPVLAVDPLQLAAWLDGRLDATETAAVDRALLACPPLLQTALDVRRTGGPEIPGAAFIAQVQALVPGKGNLLPARDFGGRRLGWGMVAATLLIVSVTGFGVGVSVGDTMAPLIHPGHARSAGVNGGDNTAAIIGVGIG